MGWSSVPCVVHADFQCPMEGIHKAVGCGMMYPCERHLYYAQFRQCVEMFRLNLSPLVRGDELTAASVGKEPHSRACTIAYSMYLVYHGVCFRPARETFLCFQAVRQSC